MSTYHKIQSIFKRDPATKNKTFLESDYSLPEFEYLAYNQWVFTEKVDGTNIRVMFDGGGVVEFGGKTDGAQIPATLYKELNEIFRAEALRGVFDHPVIFYGEGYGAKIQKGGGNYREDQGFVLFDIKIGDYWLRRDDIEEIAAKLNIDVVPILGVGTLKEAVEACRKGFTSMWGVFEAEGIVAKPKVELKARNGSRIITKVKCRDFPKSDATDKPAY